MVIFVTNLMGLPAFLNNDDILLMFFDHNQQSQESRALYTMPSTKALVSTKLYASRRAGKTSGVKTAFKSAAPTPTI